MRRLILPLIFGIVGTVILLGLGTWQLQRLAWKESVLAEIEAQIHADPVALPAAPNRETHRYLPVRVVGRATGEELHILGSRKGMGAAFHIVAAFETDDGRRILIDRGIVPEADRAAPRPAGPLEVTGNLHWPQESDSFTPEPDAERGIWFARDVPRMAAELNTEPVLIIAREDTGAGILPVPVDSSAIANDHLGYAITWFLLAAVWAGMTGVLLWRIRHGKD